MSVESPNKKIIYILIKNERELKYLGQNSYNNPRRIYEIGTTIPVFVQDIPNMDLVAHQIKP